MAFATAAMTTIEVNATFYRTQTPATFRRWRDDSSPGCVFSLKAPRAATQRRDLDEAGASVERFLDSGLLELGDRLGAINWQLAPTKHFDPDGLARFLDLLPAARGGVVLRHALEAQHPSFAAAQAVDLLRQRNVARVLVEKPDEAPTGDLTASFVYARLKANALDAAEGYDSVALDLWRDRFGGWAAGRVDTDLALLASPPAAGTPRACFVYFIAGDKVRAPDAARALLSRLRDKHPPPADLS